MSAARETRTEPFRLRGANFNLLVLRLFDPRAEVVAPALAEQFRRAPGMLRHAPVAIGLDDLACEPSEVDFAALVRALREALIVPIGATGGTAAMRAAAQSAGLAVLRGAGDTEPPAAPAPAPAAEEAAPAASPASAPGVARPTLLVEQNVRSGQRIWAQGSDLIVHGTVNPGGEVIADGHIHIYGPLRGRAIAGGAENAEARIFALQFDPELVSIAGYYATREGLGQAPIGKPTQVRLVGENMVFDRLA